ncbi:hypothetical protein PR202_ga21850 [Eleusine coracana subsp. coracana]|uniref:Neprosin PEP catalytic domain-containing protein n=1 Tax=Eleusine coracana subsp. coracana TaxID=191504 RepID=A0AAV5D213_ELECO|nr:hypothetical protein PR202_ga21850 [Eleusine coracana subsp. coracana]
MLPRESSSWSWRCAGQCCSVFAMAVIVLLLFLAPPLAVSASSSTKMARIQMHLDRMNKPAVRSIQSEDGDIIDCVERQKQHGLEHPLLKAHAIQQTQPLRPYSSFHFQFQQQASSRGTTADTALRGTVAIRRTTADDVLRASSVARFGRKIIRTVDADAARAANAPDVVTGNGHEHAIAYTAAAGTAVYGAKATINVWDPAIQESNGFSLSQLWILSGSFNGSDLNSIEAGWQVSPELYGDSRPRLFTYWTSDAYEATGCYNALCPGFVQTSSRIAIGASISPVSSPEGSQYDMTLLVWKDPKLGNWWLSYGDQLVGYWPAELFTHLSDHATMVEWGGEVVGHQARRRAHRHADGLRPLRRRGLRPGQLLPQPRDGGRRQQPGAGARGCTPDAGRERRMLRHSQGLRSRRRWMGNALFYYGGPGHNPACP